MSVSHLHMVSIDEVAAILNASIEHTVRWLKRNRIALHLIGGEKRVFEIDVVYSIHTLYVIELIKKYPSRWESKYRMIANDSIVCELVISDIKNSIPTKPISRIRNLTESDKTLIKKLNE